MSEPSAEVCLANIGPREQRKRMTYGVVALAVGVAIGLALWGSGVHRGWRLVLALPFWMGALGVFQAREKT
ncbi:hypothetical protein L6R53_01910 [Myxococcota bacterium]|nr:hypothetical protein [Myxococcota bacterium]